MTASTCLDLDMLASDDACDIRPVLPAFIEQITRNAAASDEGPEPGADAARWTASLDIPAEPAVQYGRAPRMTYYCKHCCG
jgi:hypothetical protein